MDRVAARRSGTPPTSTEFHVANQDRNVQSIKRSSEQARSTRRETVTMAGGELSTREYATQLRLDRRDAVPHPCYPSLGHLRCGLVTIAAWVTDSVRTALQLP